MGQHMTNISKNLHKSCITRYSYLRNELIFGLNALTFQAGSGYHTPGPQFTCKQQEPSKINRIRTICKMKFIRIDTNESAMDRHGLKLWENDTLRSRKPLHVLPGRFYPTISTTSIKSIELCLTRGRRHGAQPGKLPISAAVRNCFSHQRRRVETLCKGSL